MYVVWKTRELKVRWCPDCHTSGGGKLYALIPQIVESRRINGKPRQVHLARLPSIRSCCLYSPAALGKWWQRIDRALFRLHLGRWEEAIRVRLDQKVRSPGTGSRHERSRGDGPGSFSEALGVLGLSCPYSKAQVKSAFRLLAKRHHPDYGGKAEQFRKVYAAYELALSRAAA